MEIDCVRRKISFIAARTKWAEIRFTDPNTSIIVTKSQGGRI